MMDDRQGSGETGRTCPKAAVRHPRLSPSRLRNLHSLHVFGTVSQCLPFPPVVSSPGVSLGVPRCLLSELDGF